LVLINSVLTSLPMFMSSFFKVTKGVLEKIEYFRSIFFGKMIVKRKNINLQNGVLMCQPKDQGGLGV
jgi:hypothetical protein